MALLAQTFNVNDLPVSDNDYGPIPEGSYTAKIVSTELKNTKDGTGQYISFRFDILGPTHQGRVVWSNINIVNKSTQAEEIGKQTLGRIMRAIGLTELEDTNQFVGADLEIKVGISQREGYDPSNDVKGYKAIKGGTLPNVSSEPKAESAPAKAAPPWQKK